MFVATAVVATALAMGGAHAKAACALEAEKGPVHIQDVPAGWKMELVGIGFDHRMRPTAVIRAGAGRNSHTAVFVPGSRVHGGAELVSIGRVSALIRRGGVLYLLKLKNRAIRRDWHSWLKNAPQCPKR